MADDAEYYVKFPNRSTQSFSQSKNRDEDDFALVQNESKPPAVILLGWAGCQDKHLAKYSAIYEEKGCITLRCTAPLQLLFVKRDRIQALGHRLVDAIMDLNLNEHPIFFHVFSNGGAYLYKQITLAMQEETTTIKVAGVMWDSAPGERRLWSLYLALRAILEARCCGRLQVLWGFPVAMTLALFLTLWWLSDLTVRFIETNTPQNLDPLAELWELPSTCPQLFIYSRADRLIRSKDVERFAEYRRMMGDKITFVRFEDSPHVQHFLVHREAYLGAIMSFMKGILKEIS